MAGRLSLPASELLVQYARAHRDPRNLATHRVGVPMLVFGLAVLFARPHLGVGAQWLSLAWCAWALAALWYASRGHLGLGLGTAAGTALLVAAAHLAAGGSLAQWLGFGLSFVAAGALLLRAGHYYEGRRPAPPPDLAGLLAPPLFVAAEALFACGRARELAAEIERRAGPAVLRDLAHPAA